MGRLTLITGGARAGKTRFALSLARAHAGPVTYLATAEALDEEMATRIARHRAERPSGWRTIEAPLDPVTALDSPAVTGLVLFDCITVWTSNLLVRALSSDDFTSDDGERASATVHAAVHRLLRWCEGTRADLVAVTNEVGFGIVPATPLARIYRDVLGCANQALASQAERVYLVVAGLALELRGAGAVPVERPHLPD
jgi:adenosylcobinamide kinase/adenosylcobinamide-phosphate guanylyltransferase